MIKKLPYVEFKKIYKRVPRLCVDLLIRNNKGEILLTKRDIPPDLGWWHFPGGTVLLGESMEDAIQRVGMEELQTRLKVKKLLGINEYHKSGFGYPLAATYLVEAQGKLLGGEQAREIGFFKKLPEKTLPEVKEFINFLNSKQDG